MIPLMKFAFLGLQRLKHLDTNIRKRQENHERLDAVLRENPELILLDRSHMSSHSPLNAPTLGPTHPGIAEAPLVLHLRFRSALDKINLSIAYAKLNKLGGSST